MALDAAEAEAVASHRHSSSNSSRVQLRVRRGIRPHSGVVQRRDRQLQPARHKRDAAARLAGWQTTWVSSLACRKKCKERGGLTMCSMLEKTPACRHPGLATCAFLHMVVLTCLLVLQA